MAAEPVASQKEDPNVTKQSWYQNAMEEMENMHFSTPHIQNLFDDGTMGYYWVITLSRGRFPDGSPSGRYGLFQHFPYDGPD